MMLAHMAGVTQECSRKEIPCVYVIQREIITRSAKCSYSLEPMFRENCQVCHEDLKTCASKQTGVLQKVKAVNSAAELPAHFQTLCASGVDVQEIFPVPVASRLKQASCCLVIKMYGKAHLLQVFLLRLSARLQLYCFLTSSLSVRKLRSTFVCLLASQPMSIFSQVICALAVRRC